MRERRVAFFILFLVGLLVFFSAVASPSPVYASPAGEYDYVDNNVSDVDVSPDKGTHSNFTAQQYGPDSIYDTLTEENGGVLNLAFLVGNDQKLDANKDTPIKNYLENAGHTVTIKDDKDTSYDPTSFDTIVISESVPSSNTGWLKNEAVGILTVEGGNNDEFELASSGASSTQTDNDVKIVNVDHYITEEYNLDDVVTIATLDTNRGHMSGWANDVTLLAHSNNDPSEAWILAVEKGGTLQGGVDTAAERRVLLAAQYFDNLNSNGEYFFDRALEWVSYTEENYELDLEVQWTSTTYDLPNEELCIFGGTMGSENIRVDVWNGSTWHNLFTDLSSGWSNVSVTDYLVSPTFTIRFKGGTETGDTSQDSWEIDCTLLHTWGIAPTANFSYTPEYPYTGETVTFNASDSYDPDGSIVSYTWDFDDGNTTTVADPIIKHAHAADGTYTVNLTVTDDDGLTDTDMKSVNVGKLSSTISISVSPASITIGENTTISGSITPTRVGVSITIWHRLGGEGTWSILTNVTTDQNSEYSYDWTPSEAGTYALKASWAGDIDTRPAETSIVTVACARAHTSPPVISVLFPENKTYDTSDIPLTFTVSEPTSWIGYSLDGQVNVTISGNTTIVGLSDGAHTITVYANDAAGNTGTSEIVYFTIESQQQEPQPEPEPAEPSQLWIVAVIAIIAGVGFAVTFYIAYDLFRNERRHNLAFRARIEGFLGYRCLQTT